MQPAKAEQRLPAGEASRITAPKEGEADPVADIEAQAGDRDAKVAILKHLVVAYTFEAGIIFHSEPTPYQLFRCQQSPDLIVGYCWYPVGVRRPMM